MKITGEQLQQVFDKLEAKRRRKLGETGRRSATVAEDGPPPIEWLWEHRATILLGEVLGLVKPQPATESTATPAPADAGYRAHVDGLAAKHGRRIGQPISLTDYVESGGA